MCVVCGEDCSGRPRVKDTQGRYRCKPCFEAAKAAAAAPVRAPAPVDIPTAVPEMADDDAGLMAALIDSPAPAVEGPRHCQSCGGPMPAEAAVCLHCGFNQETGRSMKTKVSKERGTGAAAAKVGHALIFANPLMWAAGGLLGGGLGAALWALISWKAHFEIGWIAWIVGVMTGVGVKVFARERAGGLSGGLAVIIAIISIAVGKYASVALQVDEIASGAKATAVSLSDDDLKGIMADELAAEMMERGDKMYWPPGKDYDSAEALDDYPREVRDEVNKKWRTATPQWKSAYRADREAEIKAVISANIDAVKQVGFESSFTLFDILWAVLAIGSAWSVGSGVGLDSSDD